MSTSDQDMLPPPPNAEQIRRREFATVRRGYDPEQVRTYLSSIADQTELLEQELNRARLELTSAATRSPQADPLAASPPAPPAEDPYEALSKRFAGLIETADQEAVKILDNAKSEARQALAEARSEADRIRVDAQAHAEEGRQEVADLLERATTEADRVLSTLSERRRSLTAHLQEMRAKLISMAEDLKIPLEEAEREEKREVKEETEVAEVADEAAAPPADRQKERVPLKKEKSIEIPEEAETSVEAESAGETETSGEAEDSPYEGLWVKKEEPLQIPDLASLDLHTEERDK